MSHALPCLAADTSRRRGHTRYLVSRPQGQEQMNGLLKLRGARLRATIARLNTVKQQLRADPPQVPMLAPAHEYAAAPVAEMHNAHLQPQALPALCILTTDERTVLVAKKRGPKGGPRSCGTGDDFVRHLEAENARLRCEDMRMRAMIVSLGGSVEALDDPMEGGSGCGGKDYDDNVDGNASGEATPAACAARTTMCAATAQAKAAVVSASPYASCPLTGASLCGAAPSSSAAWAREAPKTRSLLTTVPAASTLGGGGSSRLAPAAPSTSLASAAAPPTVQPASLFASAASAAAAPALPTAGAAPRPAAPPPGTSSAAPGAKCAMAAAATAFLE